MHVPSNHENQLTKPSGKVTEMNKVNPQEVLKTSSSVLDIENGTDMIFPLVSVTKYLFLLIFFYSSKDHDSTWNQTRLQSSKQMPTAKPFFCTTHRLKRKNSKETYKLILLNSKTFINNYDHCQLHINQREQFVLKRSARLNLDPGRDD